MTPCVSQTGGSKHISGKLPDYGPENCDHQDKRLVDDFKTWQRFYCAACMELVDIGEKVKA